MELLKIFLLIFVSLRRLEAGVQFRHFPITDGRSESHDTSKSETRIIAKPTGRPSRPSDLNPLNLINEDNMFPQEKPQRSGSLADEIKKQLSAQRLTLCRKEGHFLDAIISLCLHNVPLD